MNKVAVLMSTYNGEKYLREQIDSILSQKGDFDLQLVVRDDGSNDGTQDILREYENLGKIKWYQGENSGPAKSFMELLLKSEGYDYYAFADQDDYWLEDKIESGISKINNDNPMLYFSNGMVVDENLEYLGNNVYKKAPSTDFNTVLCAGGLLGCTMIFNEKLAAILRSRDLPSAMVMHDFYVALVCSGIGGSIIYDNEPHIKYRQHGGNVVGVSHGILGKIKDRFKSIKQKPRISVESQANDILNRYSDIIQGDKKNFLAKVAGYKKSFWSRFCLACSLKTRYVNMNKSITLRLAILLGNR